MNDFSPTYMEKVMYELRGIYESYGYAQYKMSKFEEYDLYVRNKSFLLSDHIIAFTDTDGKLMALKPDVTLSIVKNSSISESGVRKVYYNENVYRVPRGAFSFKEIMQMGLECIGEIDMYSVSEVLLLAAKSLRAVSPDFVLDVSHLGIISSVIDKADIGRENREKLLVAISEKNLQAIDLLCREMSIDEKISKILTALISMNGGCDEMLEILKDSDVIDEACEFAKTVNILKTRFGNKVRIDFSVIDDMRYYNGIVFKGFVKGIPTSVLSGGRYDSLMARMGKKSGAIGFALYLDLISELECDDADEYDGDVFVLYTSETPIERIADSIDAFTSAGKRVQSGKVIPEKLRYKETVKL